MLSVRPQPREDKGDGHHQEEADRVDKLGALENTKEVGQLLIEVSVMDPHHDRGNDDSAENTGIDRLNTGDNFQAGTVRIRVIQRNRGVVIQLEESRTALAPEIQHTGHQIVEGQIDHSGFEDGTSVCGLCERNRQTQHEKELYLPENGPCAVKPNSPRLVPEGIFVREIANNIWEGGNGADTDR